MNFDPAWHQSSDGQPDQVAERAAKPVKVVIDTPGVSITVETTGQPTAEVAHLALQLFRDAGGWPKEPRVSAGFTHIDQPIGEP